MNDFCPTCSTYYRDGQTCPTCGRPRPLAQGSGQVEVLATLGFEGDVMPGVVWAEAALVAPFLMQAGPDSRAFGRLVGVDPASPSELWRLDLPDELISSPLMARGQVVYVSTQSADPLARSARLRALAADTGAELWTWQANMRALSAPALARDQLWVIGDDNTLWPLQISDGAVGAAVKIRGERHILPPAVCGERLLAPTRGPDLICIDASSRQELWRYRHNAAAWAGTPLPYGALALAPFTDGSIVALELDSGKVHWRQQVEERGGLPPLSSDGKAVFAGGRRGVQAFSMQDGAPLWRMPSERRVEAAPVLYQGALVVAGHDHIVRGLDPATGKVLWFWQGERRFEADPLIVPQGLALFDAGDALTLIRTPEVELSLEQWLDAHDWRSAASGLARAGRLQQAAALLEEHDDPLAAAQLWAQAGELQRALAQYEQAETEAGWTLAAQLHENAGDWVARAVALQRAAELGANADAWRRAQQAYQDAGMTREAAACWREVCRLRRYPFVQVDVIPEDGFVKDQFNVLSLVIHNEGPGVAATLSARANGPFAGEHMQSQMIGNLAPKRDIELKLGLMPQFAGKVPLELEVSFLLGPKGEPHLVRQRRFVAVAEHAAQRQAGEDLRRELTDDFQVPHRDSFRRSADEIESLYRQQLQRHKENLAQRELERAQYGLSAPLWLENEIKHESGKIRELEEKLDRLHATPAEEGAGRGI